MKRHLLAILSFALLTACAEPKPVAKISGITKTNTRDVNIRHRLGIKNIAINKGIFSDTIAMDKEFCLLTVDRNHKTIFLKNNYNLEVNTTVNPWVFTGIGSETNNYLVQRQVITDKVNRNLDSINRLTKPDFLNMVERLTLNFNTLLAKYPKLDDKVEITEQQNFPQFINNVKEAYKTHHNITTFYSKGDPSPKFVDFLNYKGGKTSLDDLKGNYVYIDIWATWCPPCKAEIPFLKKLEEEYKHKNIKFVSISIDNPREIDKWHKMINDRRMGGVQLFANNDLRFTEAYQVTGIPRFILLDTEGKIIFDVAPRPSSGEMENIFKYLP
ncbi:TlpA family protein disulfide reductase [Flavobacteriaceae bacterium]|nr:TlpA family protein disulfide reductase [Flavobacteriaceae bacterium]